MTKQEMLQEIADVYYPESYPANCGAKDGFIKSRMHMSKTQIETLHALGVKVAEQRKG